MPGILEILVSILAMALMIGGVWLVCACLAHGIRKRQRQTADRIQELENRVQQLEN